MYLEIETGYTVKEPYSHEANRIKNLKKHGANKTAVNTYNKKSKTEKSFKRYARKKVRSEHRRDSVIANAYNLSVLADKYTISYLSPETAKTESPRNRGAYKKMAKLAKTA